MSHFTTIASQVRDVQALKSACAERSPSKEPFNCSAFELLLFKAL